MYSALHVSQLQPYVASTTFVTDTTNPGPLYADKRGDLYAVESILPKRCKGKSWEYLVKWQGYSDFENTWEPFKHVRHLPDLLLAAQLSLPFTHFAAFLQF